MKRLVILATITVLLSLLPNGVYGQADGKAANGRSAEKAKVPADDPIAMGHPLSHWMKAIRDRDFEEGELAFEAIVELGPSAWRVVPDLAAILEAPFSPIRLGTDSRGEIHAKLRDIHFRAGAVDGLGAIGKAAATAAEPAILWGLTTRVVATDPLAARDRLFIRLVGVDVLERMRVAGAVAQFGIGAAGAVQALVESPDNERRKFAAAILNDTTVLVATELMWSERCEDRMTGLALLSAMWPVVSKDHLAMLKESLSCTDTGTEPAAPQRRSIYELN
jgi:hypothetical protein